MYRKKETEKEHQIHEALLQKDAEEMKECARLNYSDNDSFFHNSEVSIGELKRRVEAKKQGKPTPAKRLEIPESKMGQLQGLSESEDSD